MGPGPPHQLEQGKSAARVTFSAPITLISMCMTLAALPSQCVNVEHSIINNEGMGLFWGLELKVAKPVDCCLVFDLSERFRFLLFCHWFRYKYLPHAWFVHACVVYT